MKNWISSFLNSSLNAIKKLNLLLIVILAISFAIIISIYLRSDLMLALKLQTIAILFVIFALFSFSLWFRSWQISNVQAMLLLSRQERVITIFLQAGRGLFLIGLLWLIINATPLLFIMSVQTNGIVMESHTIQDSKNSSATCIKKVSYTISNQRYLLTDKYILSPLGSCHSAGERINVSFDISNPLKASSMTLFERFFYPVIFLFGAFISFFIAYLARIANQI